MRVAAIVLALGACGGSDDAGVRQAAPVPGLPPLANFYCTDSVQQPGYDRCHRTFSDCNSFREIRQANGMESEACRAQGGAGCFDMRIIVSDILVEDCYSTLEECDSMRNFVETTKARDVELLSSCEPRR